MAETCGRSLATSTTPGGAQNLDWMAIYRPDDFCHVIHIPVHLHPLGGTRCGKKEALERLQLIVEQFDFVVFDTSDLLIERNRAAVEVPIHYRHRESGAPFEFDQGALPDTRGRLTGEAHRVSRHRARAGLRHRACRRSPSMSGKWRRFAYPRPCSAASSSIVG